MCAVRKVIGGETNLELEGEQAHHVAIRGNGFLSSVLPTVLNGDGRKHHHCPSVPHENDWGSGVYLIVFWASQEA